MSEEIATLYWQEFPRFDAGQFWPMATSICKEPFSQNKQPSELNSSLSQYWRTRPLVDFHSKRNAVEKEDKFPSRS
jgi:hypothetical protein